MTDRGDMLWGGRFESAPDPKMIELTRSIDTDIRLLEYDLRATKAHAHMLAGAGLLDAEDVPAIAQTCDEIEQLFREGELHPAPSDEDVHTFVERALSERLGELGTRIHAARSRNDLVVTDLRLFCRDASERCGEHLGALLTAVCDIAEDHVETVMPGFTHLQPAQPISLAFHLLAHGFALRRDLDRFAAAHASADVSPLGAGALAGTTLSIDPSVPAEQLGFARSFDNAMDAVSDRDFAADFLYAASVCGVHLSRLAEEIVLWTSPRFGFAQLPAAWSTGSSMMPQKRNPDLAELIRGRAAPQIADLSALLVLLKGLPLAYDRDLQEDKTLVFVNADRIEGCIVGMTGLLRALDFDRNRLEAAAAEGAMWATDLAESLVARGVPFRVAHRATGGLVADLESGGLALAEANVRQLKSHHELFESSDVGLSDPRRGMEARRSHGGTAPERVREQLQNLRFRIS